MADFDRESMLEMFIFEMNQLVEQLEQVVVQSEAEYNSGQINEIFRIMHTIKGSSAMMMYDDIAAVSHVIEDLFFYLREESPEGVDFQGLSDLVLEGADFVKMELLKIQEGQLDELGDSSAIAEKIKRFLSNLKGGSEEATAGATPAETGPINNVEHSAPSAEANLGVTGMNYYRAKITFEDGCEMENIRAYTLVYNMAGISDDITHTPVDVIDEKAIDVIRRDGFMLEFSSSKSYDEVEAHLQGTVYLRTMDLELLSTEEPERAQVVSAPPEPIIQEIQPVVPIPETPAAIEPTPVLGGADESKSKAAPVQQVISVNVNKLDALLNLMGELVIAEAMVTQNPELKGLQLESFTKEARLLRKIINNLQETITGMRMVPLANTFFKMHRIVRDMCRALDKDVDLVIIGENTEVDKNIIEHIADPIMHIIRNSIDHGIEMPEERERIGKPSKGKVTLQAAHSGSDVLIIIEDDGAGLNKQKIMNKAMENGLLRKPESEYTDKEIYQFIFMPGFSTNAKVTAYSGRGVGMDVVNTNLELAGGTALVDSTPGEGSVFTLKIPLTLAIIEGMNIMLAGAQYTIPIASIKRSFKPKSDVVFTDPDGNEMITDRGEVYNIVRLYDFFGIDGAITDIEEGILIQLENGDQSLCLLVDDLIGEQQAVVQPIPKYFSKVRGLSGCTLLGNGDISLIIDVPGFFDK